MPTIFTLNGLTIKILGRDHNPPHVHAYYGEDSALVEIETGNVYAGSLPNRELKQVQAWVAGRKEELMVRWKEMNP
jgi:hypothetical protein